ncbi:MAG: ATP-binding protein, partial [Thermoplasmata archaeon]
MENNMNYRAEDIQILSDLDAVRKRPGMYIGSTEERGLHHLLLEVVDNSVDEALAGICKNIVVKLYPNGAASVEDDGRGIPVDIHPIYNKPGLEIVLTELHSGAKFDKKVYKVSGGLHGVGIHVVNFLSEYFKVVVKRDNKIYMQEYSRGKKLNEIKEIGKVEDGKIILYENVDLELQSPTGTYVYFKPDPQVFETLNFKYDIVKGKLRSL